VRHMRIDPIEGPGDANAERAKSISVRDRMSRPAVTIAARASLGEALVLMVAHRIHYLPVVDDEGLLVGIVNEDDLLGTRREPRPDSDPVTAVMRAPVISVRPAETVNAAMRLMVDRGVGALPVVEDGRVVGIFTQSDVVTALARR
jgi:acetoin utilization protein AcuB